MKRWRLIELDVNMCFLLLQDSGIYESGWETLKKKILSKYLSVLIKMEFIYCKGARNIWKKRRKDQLYMRM